MAVVREQVEPAGEAMEKKGKHLPGEAGTWVFIFGDMTVFGLIFAVYMYHFAHDPELFRQSQEGLNQNFGAINTLLLLTSSICVVTAVRAIRHGVSKLAPKLILVAMACGVGFSIIKGLEYGAKLSHDPPLGPSTNDFFMYFYVLTGLHFFHLLIGMGVLAYLYTLTKKEALTDRQVEYLEGGACFWHLVDLLWIVLFPLLYLVHR